MVTALVWVGAAMLIAAGGVQVLTPPRIPPDFGTVPQAASQPLKAKAVGRVAPSSTSAKASSTPRSTTRRPPRRTKAASVPVEVPAGKIAPVEVRLVDTSAAGVVPTGVTSGKLDVPEAVTTVGWWVGGAGLEADAGSIVLTGHLDSRSQGEGYLAALREIKAGQQVRVRGADGQAHTFAVTGRRAYRKAQGLPPSVFDQSVQRRLVLITCTGKFNPKLGRYEDNLVVYAVPAA